MTNAELIAKIKAEIERRKNICEGIFERESDTYYQGKAVAYGELLPFLSDLEKSEKPMNPDDAMKELDEKIALVKQRGTWDGVDVDKYMDEVRGREPEMPMNQEDIDTEIGHWMDRLDDKYCLLVPHYSIQDIKDTARHFAQWGAEHLKK